MRAVRRALLAAAVVASIAVVAPAQAEVAIPTVEGPIAGTPAGAAPYDVTGAGYVEEEFFVSGTARTYTDPVRTAPYKVRVLVYRPTDRKAFNGTAIVEWENVTGQIPGGHPMFTWLHSFALREGYAYMQVAAQAVPASAGTIGQGGLGYQVFDPRYAGYQHPGDDFSFDIFSQAGQALTRRIGASLVGGLKVRREIAVGNSQSASRLHTYLERVQRDAGIYEAVLLDAGGAKTFSAEPAVPTVHLLSEDGFAATAPNVSANYRLWEVAGASHNDADESRHLSVVNPTGTKQSWEEHERFDAERHYGEEGISASATCALGIGGNEFPRRFAVAAAVHHLDRWITGGAAAPQPPRVEYDANGRPVRDAHLNITGGLRLPPIDVPVASYLGSTCLLFGQTIPLNPVTLSTLYPTHADYVAKMQAAADRAVAAGWLLAKDAADLMALAERSSIGA